MCSKMSAICNSERLFGIEMKAAIISSTWRNGVEEKHMDYIQHAQEVIKRQLSYAKPHHVIFRHSLRRGEDNVTTEARR